MAFHIFFVILKSFKPIIWMHTKGLMINCWWRNITLPPKLNVFLLIYLINLSSIVWNQRKLKKRTIWILKYGPKAGWTRRNSRYLAFYLIRNKISTMYYKTIHRLKSTTMFHITAVNCGLQLLTALCCMTFGFAFSISWVFISYEKLQKKTDAKFSSEKLFENVPENDFFFFLFLFFQIIMPI